MHLMQKTTLNLNLIRQLATKESRERCGSQILGLTTEGIVVYMNQILKFEATDKEIYVDIPRSALPSARPGKVYSIYIPKGNLKVYVPVTSQRVFLTPGVLNNADVCHAMAVMAASTKYTLQPAAKLRKIEHAKFKAKAAAEKARLEKKRKLELHTNLMLVRACILANTQVPPLTISLEEVCRTVWNNSKLNPT
ncbi:ORF28 [Ranid herpesvirus 2]|uniref:ORF28 n=1 Tax=Ranid herpesvirus 2 TaxID=389214 RepID=Q14W78_9VIRU|nr:ORF28 [Ranid herpesvirus 2]ABG25686.1 ORF28 [Ranid herpesvirus 2]